MRERVGAGRRDRKAALLREAPKLGAQVGHGVACVVDRQADVGPELDDGLMHLGLYALMEDHPAVLHDLLDARAQLAGLGIDDLELLLDAEGEQAILLLGGAGGGARALLGVLGCRAHGRRRGSRKSGGMARAGPGPGDGSGRVFILLPCELGEHPARTLLWSMFRASRLTATAMNTSSISLN